MSWFCNTPEAIAQLKICEENNCPDCEKCIWINESANAMSKYGNFVKNDTKKENVIETNHNPTPFDNLCKKVVNKQLYGDFDHPLWEEIIRVFKKGE